MIYKLLIQKDSKMLKSLSYLPIFLLLAFVIRLLFLGASVGDAIALLSLSGLYGYYLYLENNKEEPINEQTKKQLEQMNLDLREMKSTIQAIKLGNSYKR